MLDTAGHLGATGILALGQIQGAELAGVVVAAARLKRARITVDLRPVSPGDHAIPAPPHTAAGQPSGLAPLGPRWRVHATLSRNPVGDSHEELPDLVDPVERALLEDVNRASAAEATLGPVEELAPALRIRVQVEQ